MINFHHLEKSRSQWVLWLLEELGEKYKLKVYPRDRKTLLALPELKQIHPLGKSPVITDGKLTIAELTATLEYLADAYGAMAEGSHKPVTGTPDHLGRHPDVFSGDHGTGARCRIQTVSPPAGLCTTDRDTTGLPARDCQGWPGAA